MFKKGVITDEISQDFKLAVDLATEFNLDGVEVRSVNDKGPHELDNNDINNIKSILKDSNLEVCGISSPFFKCSIDDEAQIKEHIEILKRSIELAHRLDTKIVRGFTFWANGSFEDNFERIISKFEEPLKIVEKEDIVLALEFDPGVFATNARKLVKVVKAIDSPNIRALWDPGNDIYEPDAETPYPDGYELIKPYMVHMHLKDAIRNKDKGATGVPIGKGQVDYIGQFKDLIKSNYDGYVVLETHYRPKHKIDEDLLALPKGKDFSHLGYEATKECLISWNNLLNNL